MSNSTVVSYAQAAKGHTPAQPVTQSALSPALTSTISQSKDDMAHATALAAATLPVTASVPASTPSVASHDAELRDSAKATRIEAEPVKQDTEAASVGGSARSTSSLVDHTIGHGNEEDATKTEPQNVADEKLATLATSPASQESRPVEGVDAKKTRKGKKNGRNAEKNSEQEESLDLEIEHGSQNPNYTPAPIPSVNVWQQRIEAQAAAKAKVTTVASVVAKGSVPKPATEDPKKAPAVEAVSAAAVQNEATGEKTQRKSTDASRSSDQPSKRTAPRGSRLTEKEEKTPVEPLPPVADATLWPTPESAATAEEGKRKSQDKADRTEKESVEEAGPTKRQKEKWVAMPYVPTVNFQTPLPPRPSRGRGGGRTGRDASTRNQTSGASSSTANIPFSGGEKPAPAAVAATSKTSEPRSRENGGGSARAASLPPTTTKRTSMDNPTLREQRKPSAPSATERTRDTAPEPSTVSGAASRPATKYDSVSPLMLTETTSFQPLFNKGEFSRSRPEGFFSNGEQQYYSRNPQSERRNDFVPRPGGEYLKDGPVPFFKESGYPARERGEPRPERGRGGYRTRGLHGSSISSQVSQPPYAQNGQYTINTMSARQQGPYSPPGTQGPFVHQMMPSTPRQGAARGNPRLTQGNSAARGPSNGSGPKLHGLHTNSSFYPPTAEFSPYAYGHYWDAQLVSVIMLQVEYYLSVDNLCKDFFIRQRMDSQGFVPFFVIAQFNRMKELAPNVDAIRFACEQSEKLDYVVGAEDGVERLRLREKWDRFVLNMDERVEDARNDGPQQFQWRSRHSRQLLSYPSAAMNPAGYPASAPPSFPSPFPAVEQTYGPYPNGAHFEPDINGSAVNGHGYPTDTPLSATVPDFSPNPNGTTEPLTLESATTFTDQRVESLTLLFSDKKESQGSSHAHRVSASLSNGPKEASPFTGPGFAPTSHEANGTPVSPSDATSVNESSSRRSDTLSPTAVPRPCDVMWADDQWQAMASDTKTTKENYPDFRIRALGARQSAKPGETPKEMKILYAFWSHFLINNFNAGMYQEFRSCAVEDALNEIPSRVGLGRLMTYYGEVLFSNKQRLWGPERSFANLFTQHYEEARRINDLGRVPPNSSLHA